MSTIPQAALLENIAAIHKNKNKITKKNPITHTHFSSDVLNVIDLIIGKPLEK